MENVYPLTVLNAIASIDIPPVFEKLWNELKKTKTKKRLIDTTQNFNARIRGVYLIQ